MRDSYRAVDAAGKPDEFYGWFEAACAASAVRCPGSAETDLVAVLEKKKAELEALPDADARAEELTRLAAWLHRLVKTVIPRFSLDRGFEFVHAARLGERQCFLQSVLIAGCLQAAGADAGVAMVFRNLDGRATNNGHAVTLLQLPDGRHLLTDASEPDPFARHRGILVRCPQDRYVEPLFDGETPSIRRYRDVQTGRTLAAGEVRPLDFAFVRSQFYYYRGERAPGSGLVGRPPTPEGLEAARAHLETSVRLCPRNALAVFALGRVLLRQGDAAGARQRFAEACRLYAACGWVPPGPQEFLSRAR